MAEFPPILVRQPQPYDIVDNPVVLCGVGTGFEGSFIARVRDANGVALGQIAIQAGGSGIWGNYQAIVALAATPATAQGLAEVYELSAEDGSEIHKVTVPVIFGVALVDPYHGFAQYTVVPGDTLSRIAREWYGNSASWRRILEANRHQIANPNVIFPGQVLRIPQ